MDVLCFLLDVGRLGAEAERLCRDAVAGADAAVGVGKGVVAEADDGGGGDGRTGGGGRRRPLRKGNEAAELQAALRRVVAAHARFPNCARPSSAPELGKSRLPEIITSSTAVAVGILTVSEIKRAKPDKSYITLSSTCTSN